MTNIKEYIHFVHLYIIRIIDFVYKFLVYEIQFWGQEQKKVLFPVYTFDGTL